jgi:hypothetical protein
MRQVNRWVLPLLLAIVMMAMAAGFILRDIYARDVYAVPSILPPWVGSATFEFLPRVVRALVFALVGVVLGVLCFKNLVSFSGGQLRLRRGDLERRGGYSAS